MAHYIKETSSVKDAMESRRSIRRFTGESLSQAELNELFNLVRLAPSANNVQPWRFHVITDAGIKEKLKAAAFNQEQVTSAPAVIMVASDMEEAMNRLPDIIHPGMAEEKKEKTLKRLYSRFGEMSVEERGEWGVQQAYIALGFLLIAAQGAGYATVPMLGFEQEKVKEILELPSHVKFAAMVPIGHAAEEALPHHRFDTDEIITYY